MVGVCIPWERPTSAVAEGSETVGTITKAWLQAFEMTSLAAHATDRMVVLGDFNQRIPRTRVRKRTYQALLQAFAGLEITTAGDVPGAPGLTIDHIAHTKDLQAHHPHRHLGEAPDAVEKPCRTTSASGPTSVSRPTT